MSNNTRAPAQQDFVASELAGIIEVCGDSPTAIVSVERMRLWLSKLRAPVAGEAQQPAEYQRRCRPTWENARVGWTEWERCTAEQAAECEKAPLVHEWQYEVRRLYAAPQASEAQCSCPSGDGSLRHPCAVHPQASEAVLDAVQYVLKTFKADEALGFRSRDRQFAISILEDALSAQPGAQKESRDAE